MVVGHSSIFDTAMAVASFQQPALVVKRTRRLLPTGTLAGVVVKPHKPTNNRQPRH